MCICAHRVHQQPFLLLTPSRQHEHFCLVRHFGMCSWHSMRLNWECCQSLYGLRVIIHESIIWVMSQSYESWLIHVSVIQSLHVFTSHELFSSQFYDSRSMTSHDHQNKERTPRVYMSHDSSTWVIWLTHVYESWPTWIKSATTVCMTHSCRSMWVTTTKNVSVGSEPK